MVYESYLIKQQIRANPRRRQAIPESDSVACKAGSFERLCGNIMMKGYELNFKSV